MVLNYIFYKLKKPVFFFLLSILTACSGVEDFSTNSKPVVEKTPPIPEPTPDFKPSPTPKSNINLMPIYPHPAGDKVFMAYLSPNNFQNPAFDVTKVKFEKLTHITMFSMSANSNHRLQFRPSVNEADVFSRYPTDSNTFDKFCQKISDKAKYYGVKTILGLDGRNELKPVFENPTLKNIFINDIIEFISTHNMDGVDLDYEYPTSNAEGDNVVSFIQDLRTAFDALGHQEWIITLAMPKNNNYARYFNIDNLLPYVNWLNIMTYGYDAAFTSYFGHNEPLYNNPGATYNPGSASSSMDYYNNIRSVPKNKLVMGLSFFGFKHYNFNTLFGTKPQGSGTPKSASPGYKSILADLTNTATYTYYWDDVSKVPYLITSNGSIKIPGSNPAVYTNVMVTYDDEESTRLKCQYINEQGFLGAMIWHLGAGWLDDVANPISNNQPLLDAAAPYFGR